MSVIVIVAYFVAHFTALHLNCLLHRETMAVHMYDLLKRSWFAHKSGQAKA